MGLRHINKNIKLEHQRANPKKLKKSKLLLVVFGKIFEAIQNEVPFDVQNDYISQALTGDQLNNPSELLEILETRDAEWKQRVQCLEYIESKISDNDNLSPLFEEENFLLLIVGWTTQMYDERSRVTQTAAELFPSLLTQLLTKMDTPAIIFEPEHNCLSTMLEALFTLLKNKRAKTLSEIAHDVLIETVNILATVAEDLGDSAVHRIAEFLCLHTKFEVEKHEKVRAGCIAYSLFIVYGTESQEIHNNSINSGLTMDMLPLPGTASGHDKALSMVSLDSEASGGTSPVGSDVDDNENGDQLQVGSMDKQTSGDSGYGDEDEQKAQHSQSTSGTSKLFTLDKNSKVKNVKIAKLPQRAQLFQDEVFMTIFATIITNGIEDRGKESREKAMKVLKKLETTNPDILEQHIDGVFLKKYEKWKRFNAPKGKGKKGKRKRISPIKRAKTAKTVTGPKAKKETLPKPSAVQASQSVPDLHQDTADDVNVDTADSPL